MVTDIKLSTTAGYPTTYISSEVYNIAGVDGSIYIDSARDENGKPKYYSAQGVYASGVPEISLHGVMITATPQAPKPRLGIGEHVQIGNKVYEIVYTGRRKYPENGELKLVEVS